MGNASPPVSDQLSEILDDLCMRFVNNLPASEYESFERLFFAIEAAHWFYEDFYREQNASLPRLTLKSFAAHIFAHSPMLQPYVSDVDSLTSQFKSYKQEVPTCGAALLNPDMTKVVLVCGWGKYGKWGFPRGKIANDETELHAAIREVKEETGFDVTPLLDKRGEEPFFIDSYAMGRLCRIYVVTDVPESTEFKTLTRKEISKIEWVPVSSLPDNQRKPSQQADPAPTADVNSLQQGQSQQKGFWFVSQYVPKLRSFIRRRRKAAKSKVQSDGNALVQGVVKGPFTDKSHCNNGLEEALSERKSESQQQESRKDTLFTFHKTKPRVDAPVTAHINQHKKNTRDLETFGPDCANGSSMTDEERRNFFEQYVADADRRAAEIDAGDDFWPVPFITSKDFGKPKQNKPSQVVSKEPSERNMLDMPDCERRLSPSTSRTCFNSNSEFCFNRESVLKNLL